MYLQIAMNVIRSKTNQKEMKMMMSFMNALMINMILIC